MKFLRVAIPLICAGVAAVLLAASLPDTILAGDAESYRARMAELFSGKVPYFDFAFEHLPGMLIPMAAAWLLGGASGLSGYAYALAAASLACLLATSFLLLRIEAKVPVDGLTVRWLLLTVPLLPFLLFRNDSWSVLLMVGGIWLAMGGHRLASSAALGLGVLSKLWPAVWIVPQWWEGRKRSAGVLAVLALGGLLITVSPGVQSIQDPQGLHTETLMGSLFGLARSINGTDLGLTNTAAVYIDAPAWALLVDGLVGLGLAIWAMRRLRDSFSWEAGLLLAGALVGAGLIASPFFSTQYVAWIAPFVAVNRRLTRPALLISAASLVLIISWFRLFDGEVWWWSLLVARNLLLVVVTVGLIMAKTSSWAGSGRSSKDGPSLVGDP
jgi:hypothetical protein